MKKKHLFLGLSLLSLGFLSLTSCNDNNTPSETPSTEPVITETDIPSTEVPPTIDPDKPETELCVVTFYLNGEKYHTESFVKNDYLVFPTINPAEGEALSDWQDATGKIITAKRIRVTDNAEYYIFSYEVTETTKFLVTYVTDVASNATLTRNIKEGLYAPELKPERQYYELEGWYTDKDCTKAYDFATPVASEITLYAKWKQTSWTLYMCNGTTEENVVVDKVEHINKIPTLTALEKEGYLFNGWVYADGTPVLKDEVITEDTYIYANWLEIVEGMDVSYDDWLRVSYDEVATANYFNTLNAPAYNYTDYEVANSITPEFEIIRSEMKVRIYFDGNILADRIKSITQLNSNSTTKITDFNVYSNYIEFIADGTSLDFTVTLSNNKSKTYFLPEPSNNKDISFAIEDLIVNNQMINQYQYYTIKTSLIKDLPEDAVLTVECENENFSYDIETQSFKIPGSYLIENSKELTLNYKMVVSTNDYCIKKSCSNTLKNVPYTLAPSKAVVSDKMYSTTTGEYIGKTLSYTFDVELPADAFSIADLKVSLTIDGQVYTENNIKTISISDDKKTVYLTFYNSFIPKSHDGNVEYEITSSSFKLDSGDTTFEFELPQTYKFVAYPNNLYIYDIYNIHLGTDGYLYFDTTVYDEDYDLAKLAIYFYKDDDSERIVYLTELNTESKNFEFNTKYRIYSSKFKDTTYSSFSLADVVILDKETNEIVKVNDTYGNYGTTIEIK